MTNRMMTLSTCMMTPDFAGPAHFHAEAVEVVRQQVLQAHRHAYAGQAEDERARKIEQVAEAVAEERVQVRAIRVVGQRRTVGEVGQRAVLGVPPGSSSACGTSSVVTATALTR